MHNRVQITAERPCTGSHETQDETILSPCNSESKQDFARQCENTQKPKKWAGLDSNQRRLTPTGLQPVPFSHSGTDPFCLNQII